MSVRPRRWWCLARGLKLALALGLALGLGGGCTDTARLEGEHAVSERELLAQAQRPLTAYASNSQRQADLIDAAESMRARLDREGYPSATVTPQAGTPPTFIIDQGPRAEFSGLTFSGELGLTQAELTTAAACRTWFTSADGAEIRGRVKRALRAAGYLRATVAPVVEVWNAARTHVQLELSIQSGSRFTIRSSRLVLMPQSDPMQRWPAVETPLTALLDVAGSVCLPRSSSVTTARIRGYLLDRGFRDVQVVPKQKMDAEAGHIDFAYEVKLGPVHVLRAVTIDGGARSGQGFVAGRLRELQLGEPLVQSKIDQVVTDLSITGLYHRVHAVPTAGPPAADGTVPDDVRLELRELPTQHVDFSLGYGSYERFRGGVAYVDEHLFGQGLRFDVGVDVSEVGWATTASLADLYRFGPGRRVTLDILFDERKEPSYTHQDAAAGLTFGQRFKPAIDPVPWEARTSYRFTRAYDFRIEATDPGDQPEQLYSTSIIGGELRRDSRKPSIIDPDSGTLSRIGLGWSAVPLGATVDYVEASAEWSGAWSPAPWIVGTVHGAYLTRDPLVVDSMPIGERLFMGGASTVRSFTQDNLGPRSSNGEPLGGLTSAVINVEARWRPFPSLRQLEFATFYDIGTVDTQQWSLRAPWGEGVGVGLRYRTPVGPIRVDGAYNPGNSLGAEDRYAYAISVGFAF